MGMVKRYIAGSVLVNMDYSTGQLSYPCQLQVRWAVVFTRT